VAIKTRAHHARDYDLDTAPQDDANAGDVARKEVLDRIEGRPALKIAGSTGGPIETVSYDLKKLTTERIRLLRTLLVEAVVVEAENEK
jgi:hypothetical protein